MISRGDVIVFVGLNTPLRILYVEIELFKLGKDLFVNWNPVITHYDATIQRNVVDLLAPIMRKDLLDLVTFTWIYIQDPLQ